MKTWTSAVYSHFKSPPAIIVERGIIKYKFSCKKPKYVMNIYILRSFTLVIMRTDFIYTVARFNARWRVRARMNPPVISIATSRVVIRRPHHLDKPLPISLTVLHTTRRSSATWSVFGSPSATVCSLLSKIRRYYAYFACYMQKSTCHQLQQYLVMWRKFFNCRR